MESIGILRPLWFLLPEPVESWVNYSPAEGANYTLLQDWYESPGDRTFRLLQVSFFLRQNKQTFNNLYIQYRVVQTLLERYTLAGSNQAPVKVFERSLRVARDVFIEEYRHLCSLPEYFQLRDLCSWGVSFFEKEIPSIYLYCDNTTMIERVLKRGRPAERAMR